MTSCLWPFLSNRLIVLPGHEGPSFSYTQIGARFFPMIDIAVHSNFRLIKIRALVDSGASLSLFRPELANFLGIEVSRGRKIALEAISAKIEGYIHLIKAEIHGKKIDLPVAFLTDPHSSFNILGREGFFDQFVITFKEKEKLIILG